ncbi:MAG TPA: hypothetical protein DGH68_02880 [Bacteroidetes bacterium]|nr:hypothetical protein [Bacteroidota bacterium]
MRVVNVDDKPYEFCFDAQVFGPYAPGTIVDLPDAVAAHAIKRSVVLDDEGVFVRAKMEYLNDMKADPERYKAIITYDCPFVASEQCNMKGFKNLDELRTHLESHWGKPEVDDPLAPAGVVKKK